MEPVFKKQRLNGDIEDSLLTFVKLSEDLSGDETNGNILQNGFMCMNGENNNEKVVAVSTNVQQLYEKYSDIIKQEEPIGGTMDPLQLISGGGKEKCPQYTHLNKTIIYLVKTIDIDEPRDERVQDVVSLVAERFTTLREQISNPIVLRKLTSKVKSVVSSHRQRKKSRQSLFENVQDHLKVLYEMYPQVREISDRYWSSSVVPTYRETVHAIVQAIGLADPSDDRVAHAVSLTMDQYPILRSQIPNLNLRRQFIFRVKQAISKPDHKLTDPDRCILTSSPTHLEQVNVGEVEEEQPIIVELVLDGEATESSNVTFSTDELEQNKKNLSIATNDDILTRYTVNLNSNVIAEVQSK